MMRKFGQARLRELTMDAILKKHKEFYDRLTAEEIKLA